MKLFVAFFGLLALCYGASVVSQLNPNKIVDVEWETYKTTFGKSYTNKMEEDFRMKIWLQAKLDVAKHNSKFAKGLVSFKIGINQFSDMLHHEFHNTMNGYNKTIRHSIPGAKELPRFRYVKPANAKLSDDVDWRTPGAVTDVKDQGQCGSCWSFSSTGAIEGQTFLKTGNLISLSEQNLMDCSESYGNDGCAGGWMDSAFSYVIDNNGVDTESTYPYQGVEGECQFDASNIGATVSGIKDLDRGDEDMLKSAVATVGPIAVAIDASQVSFKNYNGGVYDEPDCVSDILDHAVLVVGYGTEDGNDYWLVKNSWGTSWGDQGYVKMSRGKNNQCGIATAASYPLV